jgi:hypothetical protein
MCGTMSSHDIIFCYLYLWNEVNEEERKSKFPWPKINLAYPIVYLSNPVQCEYMLYHASLY